MRLPLGQRHLRQETQIRRPWSRMRRLGFELAPGLMQVDLLIAKPQRPSRAAVGGRELRWLHPKNTPVERHRAWNIRHGQHQMIERSQRRSLPHAILLARNCDGGTFCT